MSDGRDGRQHGRGEHAGRGRPRWRRTLAACLVILAVGAAAIVLVFSTEPSAQRTGATRQTPMLVDVVEVARGDWRPQFVAMGTVEAAQDIVLRPRVGGQVVARDPAFTPGGFVAAGQTLVRIDPADYETALLRARSDLSQAEADLELEMGRQNVAQLDYELLAGDLAQADESLVLREPQLMQARARVESARAAVRQAELDLARTRVTAPFAAHVLSREVDLGSQVAAGDPLGRLVGLDAYWVVTTLPRNQLRWLELPAAPGAPGVEVTIHDPAAWPDGAKRTGRLYSQVGALDAQTRLARLLVTVADPLARDQAGDHGDPADATRPPLTIGAFVEVRIPARALAGVVRLDRELVRQDGTVWVMQDGALQIRAVEIVVQDARFAYIAGGLQDGDRVVATNLTTVAEGAPLRLSGGEAPADTAAAGAEQGAGP